MDNNPLALGQKTLQGSPKVLLFQDGSASYCIIVYKVLLIKSCCGLFLWNRTRNLKSSNLQYNTLGRWNNYLFDQASDVIIFQQKLFRLKAWPQGVLQQGQWKKSRFFIFTTTLQACLAEKFPLKAKCAWNKERSVQDLYIMTLIVQEKLKTPQRK